MANAKKRRRLRISDNFPIAKVAFPYGTYSQNAQNRFLYGWYHSEIQAVSPGSEYMEGYGMMVGKGMESGGYCYTSTVQQRAVVKNAHLKRVNK